MTKIWTIAAKELRTFFDSLTAYILIIVFLGLSGFFTWLFGHVLLALNPPPGQATDVYVRVYFKYLRENGTSFPVHGTATLVFASEHAVARRLAGRAAETADFAREEHHEELSIRRQH